MKKTMKKVITISLVGLALALTGCGTDKPAAAKQEQGSGEDAPSPSGAESSKLEIRIAHQANEKEATHQGFLKFKEIIEGEDVGIEVKIFPNAQVVGSDRDSIEAVTLGEIDKAADDKNMGVKVAAFFGSSGRIFWNNVREVNTLADFQGIKSRAPENPINIAELEALGCIPTPMAWNELYTGLQQGTVDGLVSSKMPIIQQGLIDVLKYATDTNHSYSINVILISSAKYNSFSEEQRAAYDKAIAGAAEEEWKIAMKEEEDSVQKIKELQEQGKILYTELTDEARAEIKDAMVAATEPKVEEMCGKEILETFRN